MKIGQVLEELRKPGGNLPKVVDKYGGIGEKSLRVGLIEAGYEFRRRAGEGWVYVGEGPEPLENSIFDYTAAGLARAKSGSQPRSPKINKTEVTTSPRVSLPSNISSPISNNLGELKFTSEETAVLKEMIREYMGEKKDQTSRDRLHVRIMKLEKEGRTRKTVVMSDSVAKKFDDFAAKMRFNKSDILELALLDFISSYDDEK